MGQLLDFIGDQHRSSSRDYLARVNEYPKAECARVAKQFGYDFFDGERRYGYGGYHYDGRWKPAAEKLIAHYGLKTGMSVLDIGCGKAHLLYEMKNLLPGLRVKGIDVSEYAVTHTLKEIEPYLEVGDARDLKGYSDDEFDLVISLNALHNLYIYELFPALREIERISKHAYIVVESYRNEEEEVNMLYWQLTCESFFSVDEWKWIYEQTGYRGDYGFIFFE